MRELRDLEPRDDLTNDVQQSLHVWRLNVRSAGTNVVITASAERDDFDAEDVGGVGYHL